MPLIRPITDLRNTNEISEMCHKSQKPIFITKNSVRGLNVGILWKMNSILKREE